MHTDVKAGTPHCPVRSGYSTAPHTWFETTTESQHYVLQLKSKRSEKQESFTGLAERQIEPKVAKIKFDGLQLVLRERIQPTTQLLARASVDVNQCLTIDLQEMQWSKISSGSKQHLIENMNLLFLQLQKNLGQIQNAFKTKISGA